MKWKPDKKKQAKLRKEQTEWFRNEGYKWDGNYWVKFKEKRKGRKK